jgi:hypothetical protein
VVAVLALYQAASGLFGATHPGMARPGRQHMLWGTLALLLPVLLVPLGSGGLWAAYAHEYPAAAGSDEGEGSDEGGGQAEERAGSSAERLLGSRQGASADRLPHSR